MANAAHSILPPSGAGSWVHCPAWVLMQLTYPDLEDEQQAAREGTAVHEVAASMIQWATVAQGSHMRIGDVASNGEVISEEMYEAAEIYADHATDEMRRRGIFGGENIGIEKRITIPGIHPECFGTPDFFLYDRKAAELLVYDLKYGHDFVQVIENWQLIAYTAGLFDLYKFDGLSDQYITVIFRIAQPRVYNGKSPVSEWRVKLCDLRGQFNILQAAATAALSQDPKANSGSHCKHCNGRHVCKAALRGGFSLYEVATDAMPFNMSPHAIGVQAAIIRRAHEQLKALDIAYTEMIAAMMKKGGNIPGWGYETTSSRRKWNKSDQEVIALGQMFGKDLSKSGVITPTQAEKLGIDSNVIKAYCQPVATGFKPVIDNGTKAREVFGNGSN